MTNNVDELLFGGIPRKEMLVVSASSDSKIHKVDLRSVQKAHAVLIQNGRYDLALTYMGPAIGWTVLRFNVERGCWYNPENRYKESEDALTAVMSAILLDIEEGYTPEWGRLVNKNGVEFIM